MSYTEDSRIKVGDVVIFKNKTLGSGIFGFVLEGTHCGKPCAVKVLKEIGMVIVSDFDFAVSDLGIQEAGLKCFKRESMILNQIQSHPNVVKLFDICLYPRGKFPMIVMELLDCSLRQYLASLQMHDFPIDTQISFCKDIAAGLSFLHEKTIVHRDLCGDNILIKKQGKNCPVAKISDFGTSRLIDLEKLTHSLSRMGHRDGYMPPEGPQLNALYDSSLDIFMFGAVMTQIAHKIENISTAQQRQYLIDKLPRVHPLKDLIQSCVANNKSKRPKAADIHLELQVKSNFQMKVA